MENENEDVIVGQLLFCVCVFFLELMICLGELFLLFFWLLVLLVFRGKMIKWLLIDWLFVIRMAEPYNICKERILSTVCSTNNNYEKGSNINGRVRKGSMDAPIPKTQQLLMKNMLIIIFVHAAICYYSSTKIGFILL